MDHLEAAMFLQLHFDGVLDLLQFGERRAVHTKHDETDVFVQVRHQGVQEAVGVEARKTDRHPVFNLGVLEAEGPFHTAANQPFKAPNCSKMKQAGTGPSRRHIQGSKIEKRLPSVKYSFTVVENRKFFENFFLKKLHTKKMDRVKRRGSLPRAPGALTSHNAEKLKGGTL